jgi:hypothetical protein
MARYLTRGSKPDIDQMDIDRSLDLMTSYPPTPYVPGSPNHISLELDISIMTGDSSDQQLSPPPPSLHHSPISGSPVISPSFQRRFTDEGRNDSISSSGPEELKAFYLNKEENIEQTEEGENKVITSPVLRRIPPDSRFIKKMETIDDELVVDYGAPGSSREGIPVGIRPPVYPIVPGASSGVALSSSEEESMVEQDEVKRGGKVMTARIAAIIASRFLTAMKKTPVQRQASLGKKQQGVATEKTDEIKESVEINDEEDENQRKESSSDSD